MSGRRFGTDLPIQKTIKETFALNEVPREALTIGLAGVLPYLATSLTTVYLAFDINHVNSAGTTFFFSQEVAEQLLHIIEPLQIGYGAVVSTSSFHESPLFLIYPDHLIPRSYPLGT